MEDKIKHLEFIQNIITRMNSNSFFIKGSTVTIVSALLAIYASTKIFHFVILGILPTLLFWILDSYYLQQERKFRGLYNDAAGITKNNKIKLFEMSIEKYTNNKYSYWNVFFSKTLLILYPMIILILIVVSFIIYFC